MLEWESAMYVSPTTVYTTEYELTDQLFDSAKPYATPWSEVRSF